MRLLESCRSIITNKKNLTDQEKQLVSTTGTFGLKLFQQVNEVAGDSNFFIPQLSVSTALGMTLNGTNGKTYDEIKLSLELTRTNQDEFKKNYYSLNNLLTQIDPEIIFESAIQFATGRAFPLSKAFLM